MRFLADHDVPERVAQVLCAEEHDVARVRDVLARDASDEEVWALASAQNRLVLTCNRDDFLRLAGQTAHPGLIVLVRRERRIDECSALLRLLARAGESGLVGNINFA